MYNKNNLWVLKGSGPFVYQKCLIEGLCSVMIHRPHPPPIRSSCQKLVTPTPLKSLKVSNWYILVIIV